MADNVSKFVYFGDTIFDITDTTAEESRVLSGSTFYGADGAKKTGSCTYDSDTSGDTALASQILKDQTAHARGAKLTGTMENRGGVTGTISAKAGQYTIQAGYHDGSGKVGISSTEQAKIIAGNIKQGVTILGVQGNYSGAGVNLQSKTATPTNAQQTISPDSGYDALSSVTVNAIPYSSQLNSAGGYTVTIG